jgi:hypothetical protein
MGAGTEQRFPRLFFRRQAILTSDVNKRTHGQARVSTPVRVTIGQKQSLAVVGAPVSLVAASPNCLRYVSPELRLRVLETDAPGDAEYDGWKFVEHFSPDAYDRKGIKFGSYRLIVQKGVSHIDELATAVVEGVGLIEDLERVWPFATGMALRGFGFDIGLAPITAPAGWKGNEESLRL